MKPSCLFSASILLFSTLQAGHGASIPVYRRKKDVDKVASAWFSGGHATSTPAFPVSDISWSKYTHVTYAFALTTPDVTNVTLEGSSPDVLPQFVEAAHRNGVKAVGSIGGWTGSQWWSSNVGSAENRTLFVKTLTDFAEQYQLDGLEFDWEYPVQQGIGCNTNNPQDSANFLAFLEELREDCIGKDLILTAAVVSPFSSSDGTPSKDVSGFASVLDWVNIMNYDMWGSWSATVGPNSPLYDSCAAPANQVGSASSEVNAWQAAGMPLDKIVLGVAAYGHSFSVNKTAAFNGSSLALYPAFDKADQPAGDVWDDVASTDICGNANGPGGTMRFWGLMELGYLNTDGTPRTGIDYIFDDCSKTAYVYNKTSEIMVSYDDAQAFADKGSFITSTGLRGFTMWEAGGDYNNILLDAIRETSGFH
ncbi:endochitinase [Amanita rubescens]|nr:endochitinase [Amanita rubescens]